MSTIDPRKYITFKRSDWSLYWEGQTPGYKPQELTDAVVIRQQDRFAHTALSAYAAGVLNAAEIIEAMNLEGVMMTDDLKHLYDLADFFAGLADEARTSTRKFPD